MQRSPRQVHLPLQILPHAHLHLCWTAWATRVNVRTKTTQNWDWPPHAWSVEWCASAKLNLLQVQLRTRIQNAWRQRVSRDGLSRQVTHGGQNQSSSSGLLEAQGNHEEILSRSSRSNARIVRLFERSKLKLTSSLDLQVQNERTLHWRRHQPNTGLAWAS